MKGPSRAKERVLFYKTISLLRDGSRGEEGILFYKNISLLWRMWSLKNGSIFIKQYPSGARQRGEAMAVCCEVGGGGEEGTEAVGQHVFLRIPDVALRAEEFRAGHRIGGGGVEPFENFEQGGHGENGGDGKQQAESAMMAEAAALDEFHDAEGKESNRKMGEAVEMVSLCADEVGDPSEGNLGEGVVSAKGVQEDEDGHEDVGGVGKADALEVHPNQRGHDAHDREVFRNPRGARSGTNGQEDEFEKIKGKENNR